MKSKISLFSPSPPLLLRLAMRQDCSFCYDHRSSKPVLRCDSGLRNLSTIFLIQYTSVENEIYSIYWLHSSLYTPIKIPLLELISSRAIEVNRIYTEYKHHGVNIITSASGRPPIITKLVHIDLFKQHSRYNWGPIKIQPHLNAVTNRQY